jgi:hypothetical protein
LQEVESWHASAISFIIVTVNQGESSKEGTMHTLFGIAGLVLLTLVSGASS